MMKLYKLLLIFVLFIVTVDAAGICKDNTKCVTKVSFSIEKIWQSHKKIKRCDSCDVNNDDDGHKWKQRQSIQQYYDGCNTVFSTFHGNANDFGLNAMNSFEVFLTKLIEFSNCNSTTLASTSNDILQLMAKLNKLGQSSTQIIKEAGNVINVVVYDLKDVTSKLSGTIGSLSAPLHDALDDLGYEYGRYIQEFLLSCESFGCKKKVDIIPTFKKCQNLMNTVALIAKTLPNKCEASVEVHEAVLVLILISWYFTVGVQGLNSAVQDVLFENNGNISQNVLSASISFDYVLISIPDAFSAVVVTVTKTIEDVLGVFVKLTKAFNQMVRDIFGIFEGTVLTVADVTRNLTEGADITSIAKL